MKRRGGRDWRFGGLDDTLQTTMSYFVDPNGLYISGYRQGECDPAAWQAARRLDLAKVLRIPSLSPAIGVDPGDDSGATFKASTTAVAWEEVFEVRGPRGVRLARIARQRRFMYSIPVAL
jgi:hypothetical protein